MSRGKSNLPINYQEQLEQEAAQIQKRISASSGDKIRFNNNHGFITPDGMEGETMEVVIVDFVSSNMYYDSQYNKDNPQPPACFAIGPEPSTLTPSENSPDKQASTCSSCPMNQFGSAGKGKACKNTRLLGVTPASSLGSEDAPVWIMSIPPTSLKFFDSYVQSLSQKHRTIPLGVVTEVYMDQANQYAAPRFKLMRPLDGEEIASVMSMRDVVRERIKAEPDVSQYQAPKPARGAPARRGR